MEIFHFDGNPYRTIPIDGEPWFVAADIAKILGYRDAERLARRLDEDEKGTHPVGTPGGEQIMTVVSEPGLYTAILGSKVERAKAFRRQVTHEVLPQIRKTGSYSIAGARPDFDALLADGPGTLMLLSEASRRLAVSMAQNQALSRELETFEAKVVEMAPRARLADRILTAEGDMQVRDAAQCLAADHGIDIGRDRLFDYLRELKWLDATGRPMQRHVEAGRLRTRPTTYEHPHTHERVVGRPQVRITAKGFGELQLELIP
jgi:anti-repressor protein